MQPVYARQAFPCFDEPWMKATFQLTLLTDPSVPMALFNMPLLHGSGNIDASTGLKEWRFGTSPVMSSYLVAFALGESLQVDLSTFCRYKDICNCQCQIPTSLRTERWNEEDQPIPVQAVGEPLWLLSGVRARVVDISAK